MQNGGRFALPWLSISALDRPEREARSRSMTHHTKRHGSRAPEPRRCAGRAGAFCGAGPRQATPEEVADLDPPSRACCRAGRCRIIPPWRAPIPRRFEADRLSRHHARPAERPRLADPGRAPAASACRDLQFPSADPVPHARQRRSDAGDVGDGHGQPGGEQEGHQHVPDHAQLSTSMPKRPSVSR